MENRACSLPPAERMAFAPEVPGRIPSLDGLRAVSIILVVMAHASLQSRYFRPLLEHLGNHGVRIFFVISGFLITSLLLKEKQKTGGISLRSFYIRRVFRIFPAFYTYLAAIVVLTYAGVITLEKNDMLRALTYTMNYHQVRSWWLNHTWSLCVEEQFYCLWPLVLVLTGLNRGVKLAGLTIVIAPLMRALLYFGFHANGTVLGRHFEAVADALACGCVLASFYNDIGRHPSYRAFAQSTVSLAVALVLMTVPALMFKLSQPLYYLAGESLANFGTVLLIDRSVRFSGSLVGNFLNWRPLVRIGTWSYSIYLWQELFLADERDGFNLHFPLNIMATLVLSVASYYLVELRFLRIKSRFEPALAQARETGFVSSGPPEKEAV